MMYLNRSQSKLEYRIYHKYWDGQACANSLDPDQMLHSATSDQDLQCLPFIQEFWNINSVKWMLRFKEEYGKELRCPNI